MTIPTNPSAACFRRAASTTILKHLPVAALALATPALAQQTPAPDAAADSDAGPVIVTAMRAPTPIDQVDSSVTVLDKAAIDAAQAMDVTGLLLRTPGVSISRNGGFGTDTSFRLRGAEGDQTVIVLDGVKLSDPASPDGSFNMGNLLTGDAARIEVLRGPQSTLWGSQAIAGVVNIVTALPTAPLQGTMDIEGGSRRTVDARAGLGGKEGRVTWRLAGETFATDGISALDPRFGGRERDGYTNQSASGRVEIALTDVLSADLRGFYSHGRTDIDGNDPFTFAAIDTPELEVNDQWLGYAGLNAGLFGGRLRNRIGYSYTDTRRRNVDPRIVDGDETTFRSNGRTHRIDYEGTLALARGWTAVFGVEHERSRFRSISPQYQSDLDEGHATLTDEYLQLNAEVIDGLTLTGGVRHDDYRSYGSRFLFSGGAAWKLPTGTVLRARYGEGFKAPSLYQLYSQYGNDALEPTRSRGWEAGAEQHAWGDRLALGASYFERRTHDLVTFDSCYGVTPGSDPLCDSHATAGGYYINLGRSFAQGVEVTGSLHPIGGLSIDANYSWVRAISRSPGTDGNWLPRRPRQEGNASLTYRWPFGLTTAVAVRWAGHSFDDAANTRRLDAYTLVDLRADLPVDSHVSLFARVENVADEHYETVYQYGTLGRSIYAGIRGRF
ncbi:MAG: TonB-dependent receptor plug domain-containing protein [Sphingomonas sp.]